MDVVVVRSGCGVKTRALAVVSAMRAVVLGPCDAANVRSERSPADVGRKWMTIKLSAAGVSRYLGENVSDPVPASD